VTYRTDAVELLPWVRRLAVTLRCDGYRWSSAPLRAARDPEVREHYRCRGRARWQFTALPRSAPRTGAYCWSHLVHAAIHGDMIESDRAQRWFTRHVAEVNAVRVRHGLSRVSELYFTNREVRP
jgi:hypothetical protein